MFPRDDGAHDGFASEWWRTFGRVHDAKGKRYDFSVNVSRFAIGACDAAPVRSSSSWDATYLVATTYELVDEEALTVRREMHVERESPLGAAIGEDGLHLRTQYLRYAREPGASDFTLALDDANDGLRLQQTRHDAALPLGPKGVMQTGSCTSCEAYAYAYTRVATRGTLRIDGTAHDVSGSTWFEHEFAHRELAAGDAGWNRYELQFDDGRDLDARFTRDRAGKTVLVSGTFVSASGAVTYLGGRDARASNVLHTVWRSVPSGVTYPSLWFLSVPFAHLGLATVEVALDQEVREPMREPYFDGAVVVERVGPPPGDYGHGYVELTGYGAPLNL
jgi:predicted secreted hydrolase